MNKKYYLFLIILFFTTRVIAQNSIVIDTVICRGKSIQLSTQRLGIFSYLWSTGETTASISVSPAANKQYIVKSISATEVYIDVFNVIVDNPLPAPQILFLTDKLITSFTTGSIIRWVKNNIVLPGFQTDTLKFPLQGVYRSEISNLGGCWTPSQLLFVPQDTDTAIIVYSKLIYPNPSTGYFNLQLSFPRRVSKNIEIIVLDLNGRELFEKKQFIYQSALVKIPITLPAGFKGQCVLSIKLNGIVTTEQVIIQ